MEQKWRGGGGREKKGEESRRGEEEGGTAEDEGEGQKECGFSNVDESVTTGEKPIC